MEAMLALMLFGMCAVSLMKALAKSSKLAVETQMDSRLLIRLESKLTEFHKMNNIAEWEGKTENSDPDELGVWTTTEVTRMEDLKTSGQQGNAGQDVQQMYRVYVKAFYTVDWKSEPEMVDAQCWRYAPLYRTQGAAQNGTPGQQR
jgi:Tfp pilus assembly protein PilV